MIERDVPEQEFKDQAETLHEWPQEYAKENEQFVQYYRNIYHAASVTDSQEDMQRQVRTVSGNVVIEKLPFIFIADKVFKAQKHDKFIDELQQRFQNTLHVPRIRHNWLIQAPHPPLTIDSPETQTRYAEFSHKYFSNDELREAYGLAIAMRCYEYEVSRKEN